MKYYLYREKADLSLHFHSLLYSPIHTHLVYTGVAINSHRNTTLFLLLLLLSRFSHVWLCATPQMAAHQAPPSLGFSRQEHWSGLPFPSPMHESEKWKWSCSVVSNSSRPHGLQPTRLFCPWDFPAKSTGVGCHCLLHLFLLHFSKTKKFLHKKSIMFSEGDI